MAWTAGDLLSLSLETIVNLRLSLACRVHVHVCVCDVPLSFSLYSEQVFALTREPLASSLSLAIHVHIHPLSEQENSRSHAADHTVVSHAKDSE